MTPLTLRKIQVEDAAGFTALHKTLAEETHFLLLEPDELREDLDAQKQWLKGCVESDSRDIFVAHADGVIVGFLDIRGGNFNRDRHKASLSLGITRAHWGRGLGTLLIEAAISWLRDRNGTRLELTVNCNNERAVGLYQKCGFQIEGTQRNALRVDGKFVDEYFMGFLLSESYSPEHSTT
ncbi:GNAT family N-acetyltransferase [Bradymonas sediminis]|uniref:GNAT family N-acetyltransferase n=1 Tax=Bradymonas sediminis TaxID=1548548 RepID=A0A2Z4FJU7_9DELT|nr:GNAT family N-acetyltransferase [Bradymonas sediminis]AWV89231.1 GNAT family N-acetyltransferase [Bradymonas sediminis]TDP73399.1 RimJ/RimL family protein N-acetyltransferase [Bradymonas sediminis]